MKHFNLTLLTILSLFSCKPNNKVISRWENGKIKLQEIYTDTPNVQIEREFYENGQLATESRIENLLLNGKSVVYYKGGQLLGNLEYKNGKINGQVLEFHMNGKVMFKGTQSNGELVDTAVHYYDNGKIQSILLYKDHKRFVISEWDTRGKLISNIEDNHRR